MIVLDDAQRAPAAAVDELAELAGRLPAGSTLAVATPAPAGAPAAGRCARTGSRSRSARPSWR